MDLKEKILLIATDLFLKIGLRSVSIDDICKELAISKKTFYNFYKKKEDLIEDVIVKRFFADNESIQIFYNEEGSYNIIDCIFNFIDQYENSVLDLQLNLVHELNKYYPNVIEKHKMIHAQKTLDFYEFFIKRGIREGVVRKDLNIELAKKYFANADFNLIKCGETDFDDRFHVDVKDMNTIKQIAELNLRAICNKKGIEHLENNYLIKGENNKQ